MSSAKLYTYPADVDMDMDMDMDKDIGHTALGLGCPTHTPEERLSRSGLGGSRCQLGPSPCALPHSPLRPSTSKVPSPPRPVQPSTPILTEPLIPTYDPQEPLQHPVKHLLAGTSIPAYVGGLPPLSPRKGHG